MARTLTARLGDAAERAVDAARSTVLPIHPLQIDVLKLIACVCMLIDHINTCLYDRASVWAWLIGRLAFPLFGLTFVLTLKAHKAMDTAKRLFIWAICTQPVYALAFANTGFSPWWAGNILFSFASVAYLVALAQTPSAANVAKGLVVLVVASIIQAPSSFGAAGVIYMLAIYRAMYAPRTRAILWLFIVATALTQLNNGPVSLSSTLLSSICAIVAASIHFRHFGWNVILRKRCSSSFYIGHLILISFVKYINKAFFQQP